MNNVLPSKLGNFCYLQTEPTICNCKNCRESKRSQMSQFTEKACFSNAFCFWLIAYLKLLNKIAYKINLLKQRKDIEMYKNGAFTDKKKKWSIRTNKMKWIFALHSQNHSPLNPSDGGDCYEKIRWKELSTNLAGSQNRLTLLCWIRCRAIITVRRPNKERKRENPGARNVNASE